jgi:hypothetical protein
MNTECTTPDCGSHETRPYACGPRCATHAPGKMPEGRYCAPNRCYCGECPGYTPYTLHADTGATTVLDVRAVASGKRRASLPGYRAAQAAVAEHRKSA